MALKKRAAVLGATGSIGKSSIDIIARNSELFEVVLLSANSNRAKLNELSYQFPKASCVLTEEDGKDKLLNAIKNSGADIIINGISGAAGLEPSLAAIEAGSDLALANKETIVMAGNLVLKRAKEKNVNIIPVDSEHSAVFHLLKYFSQDFHRGQSPTEKNKDSNSSVNEIILTASGGPFKDLSLEEMKKVTAKDALAHPTWKMGAKISIDSASMANKGLEIIEACHFFNMPPEKIKVVIHPQ
ncbi:MAG: 1-deoxy-D-xylulose-5-phosphate reductoisomerase, partial [Treponema sp.]|nr:1-deoxy-D-xylulose-5-phosphate reductoisomerase [Treponema sp.]